MDNILEIKNIKKSFEDMDVLKGVSLSIKQGEFITILGPSGCGKTTTLRIIAGLEEPDSGVILLEGQNVTNLPPNKRNVHTVFQDYALFPHMTVADNIGYSQKLKGVSKQERYKLVKQALELVQLSKYADRMPSQLSGGQSQRIAIARAVINEPKVLLLDEPLGALDLRLRQQMQEELKTLQRQIGITFVYITHDQEEALNMSDRIVVMDKGRFEQIDAPVDIYNYPKTSFVADFIGSSNIIKGEVTNQVGDLITFRNENGTGEVMLKNGQRLIGENVTVSIRGENVTWFCEEENERPYFDGKVHEKIFAGDSMRIVIKLKDGSLIYSNQHDIACPMEIGEDVQIYWKPEKAVLVDLEESHG